MRSAQQRSRAPERSRGAINGARATGFTPAADTTGEVSSFLLDLATAMHSVAIPSNDIERRIGAVGHALGVEADAFLLQSVVVVSTRTTAFRRVDFEYHWNLRRVLELRGLSERLAAGELDLARGRAELGRIMAQPRRFPQWQVVIGYAVYGAAVTARVGGNWREIAVGIVVGLVAGGIHVGTLASRPVDLLKSFVGALAGALVSFALALVLPPFDFARALFGGVSLLVPAMLLTIGSYEVANEALESGFVRLAYGFLRFLMIAVGLVVAAQIGRALGGRSDRLAPPLPWWQVLALVAAGGLALTVCLEARRRDAIAIVVAVLLAFGTHMATKALLGGDGSALLSALVLGAAGFIHARNPNNAAGTMIIPGMLQLAPGFIGTEAVMRLLRGLPGNDSATFFKVMLTVMELVIGIMLAALIFRGRGPARVAPATAGAHH